MSSSWAINKWIITQDDIAERQRESPDYDIDDDLPPEPPNPKILFTRRNTITPLTDNNIEMAGLSSNTGNNNEGYEPDTSDEDILDISDKDEDSEPEATCNHIDETLEKTAVTSDTGKASQRPSRKKSRSKKVKNFDWDRAAESSEDNIQESTVEIWKRITIFFKLLLCLLVFSIVLVTAVFNKLCVVLMTYNINFLEQNFTVGDTMLKRADGYTDVKWIWALIITTCAPYVFTVMKCLWNLCFKKTKPILLGPLILSLVFETLHTIGLITFVFVVLPMFDPLIGILVSLNVAVIPAFLKLFHSKSTNTADTEIQCQTTSTDRNATMKAVVTRILDISVFIVHVSVLGIWTFSLLFQNREMQKDLKTATAVLLPTSLILISTHWWENYITGTAGVLFTGIKALRNRMKSQKRRTKITLLTSVWKILLTIFIPVGLFGGGTNTDCAEVMFFRKTFAENCSVFRQSWNLKHCSFDGNDVTWEPVYIALVSIFCGVVCYKVAKIACKIQLQPAAFALPLVLSTPATFLLVLELYTHPNVFGVESNIFAASANWTQPIHGESDWNNFLRHMTVDYWIPLGALGFVSLMIVARHVWLNSPERLAATEKLFIQPLYCGIMLDASMMLNRRLHEKDFNAVRREEKSRIFQTMQDDPTLLGNEAFDPKRSLRTDTTPMIYMCGTMWHENENEMVQILKSIFRCDIDQSARRNAQLFFNIVDPDYYEFEAHIFFDDAFEARLPGDFDYSVNGFVKLLVRVMDLAASSVHNVPLKIPSPKKIPTPYGGRLEWTLPGSNKIIAHLKDKAKIRHRKRWSQVMYMYYFLGFDLLGLSIETRRKAKIADNTFLLALDGDVDFQPEAVRLLVDRMVKNPSVGAACGRILPIGNGPMVWYQKFEYAISHWLQKATEHMLGSVLCSPGCFSLFRASALLDDNVMKRYTTPPTEARHYVQYDQGEDRWLCTLLLQQGYRVEYCAASDALTYAPEGFYEFFNQRRRWAPSTMANILDLLADWKNVTRKNDDISTLYIIYQTIMMASSILTPGTIFLLVTGALNAAYPEIEIWVSFIINLVPVGLFILLCFLTKSSVQLAYAAVLSLLYTLLMMVVVVGLIKSAVDDQLCSVTSIFLLLVAGIFVIAAFAHPREFTCILHGPLYFLSIPCMSLLLILYSLCNLHVVTWGTRETKQAPPTQKTTAQPTKKTGTLDEIMKTLGATDGAASDYVFGFGNLFKCLCCPRSTKDSEDAKWKLVLERLNEIDEKINTGGSRCPSILEAPVGPYFPKSDGDVKFSDAVDVIEGGDRNNPIFEELKTKERNELRDPFWIHDKDVGDGSVLFLEDQEITFWNQLLEKYLYPLEKDAKHEKQIHADLIELRNKVCLFFILLNALFITVVFVLESQESMSFNIPCKVTTKKDIAIEPLSVTFTAVFGVVLTIQFIAMLFHRMSTFLHIAAITEIRVPDYIKNPFKKKAERGETEKMKVDDAVELARDLQTFNNESDTQSVTSFEGSLTDDGTIGDRKGKNMWRKFAKRRNAMTKGQGGTLGRQFQKNFVRLVEDIKRADEDVESGSVKPQSDIYQPLARKYGNRRKSVHFFAALNQNQDLKENVIRKGEAINKFRKMAMRKANSLKEARATSSEGRSENTTAKAAMPSMLRIVRDAMEREKSANNRTNDNTSDVHEEIPMEPITERDDFSHDETDQDPTYDNMDAANSASMDFTSESPKPQAHGSQSTFPVLRNSGFIFGPPGDRHPTEISPDYDDDDLKSEHFHY